MNTAIIGLGSNINPEDNIKNALELMKWNFEVKSQSKVVKTKAIDRPADPDFLNCCVLIEVDKDKELLNEKLKDIEKALGRIKVEDKSAPRRIDLDIIAWNGAVIDKDFYARDFIKSTALEVKPDLEY